MAVRRQGAKQHTERPRRGEHRPRTHLVDEPVDLPPLVLAVEALTVGCLHREHVSAVGDRPEAGAGRKRQAGLLPQLASYGVLVRLPGVDPAAGGTPDVTVGELPAHQQGVVTGSQQEGADGLAEPERGGHGRQPRGSGAGPPGDGAVRCWRTSRDNPWMWGCLRLGSARD